MKNKNIVKVYVAMSGGVDSSVAAALLKKRGVGVIGVFFKPWQPKFVSLQADKLTSSCLWEQDRLDALRVAAKLGIEFKTWDFSKEYEKKVVWYMVNSYRIGITPNPDVMCNKEIKFGLFLKRALAEGADYIATGHYARVAYGDRGLVRNGRKPARKGVSVSQRGVRVNRRLLQARDKNKDQTYFLWTLTQEQLKRCLFPIGDYTKPEVRKLAKKFGLPNHNKKDSQGVCFVGQLDMKEFLKNYIKPRRGEIKLLSSVHDRVKMKGSKKSVRERVIGYHDGVYYYTIGQRHGLDIKDGGGPYYVARKDIKKNILYVANAVSSSQLSASSVEIKNVNWITAKPKLPLDCQVKIRYRSKSVPATITRAVLVQGLVQGRPLYDLYEIKFKKPVRALTPGQSAVIYRDQEVIGGGIIT